MRARERVGCFIICVYLVLDNYIPDLMPDLEWDCGQWTEGPSGGFSFFFFLFIFFNLLFLSEHMSRRLRSLFLGRSIRLREILFYFTLITQFGQTQKDDLLFLFFSYFIIFFFLKNLCVHIDLSDDETQLELKACLVRW